MSQFYDEPRKSILKRSLINLANSDLSDQAIMEQLVVITQQTFQNEAENIRISTSQFGGSLMEFDQVIEVIQAAINRASIVRRGKIWNIDKINTLIDLRNELLAKDQFEKSRLASESK